MDRLKDADKGSTSLKSLTKGTSTREIRHIEPMAEYKPTRDEEDLAHFGKKQQLEVRNWIFALPAYLLPSCSNHFARRETSASCPS